MLHHKDIYYDKHYANDRYTTAQLTMKRISAILIMSVLMVFLAACAGGGGGGGGVTPSGGDPISVSNLRVFPDVSSAILMWDNPDADIQHIDIIYTSGAAASLETRYRVTDPSKIVRAEKNVTQIISGLTSANYTFNIHLELKGSNENKPVEAVSITRLIGPNLDGDEYADADPRELDEDGDGIDDEQDAFPRNPSLSAFAVTELRAIPGDESVTLSWNNPTAQIASINISYHNTSTPNALQYFPLITDTAKVEMNATNVQQVIDNLVNGQSYNFTVSLTLNGTDAGKEVAAQSVNATLNLPTAGLPTGLPISVSNLRVFPDVSNATLIWDNPDADIAKISISYKLSTAASFGTPIPIMDDARIARNETDVMGMIPVGLLTTPNTNYTFSVTLELKGADENKSVIAAERTRLIGPNFDGDEYADAEDADDDNDGVNDERDAFQFDPTESVDTDGDRVGDNADAFPSDPNESVDTDGDTVGDNADVDVDGDGLIEIADAEQLNQSRHNLLGSNFTRSAGGVGDANGCGNGTMEGEDITACNGYELTQNISLADYTDWQPIGSCMSYNIGLATCSPTTQFFNATFDGKDYIISNLTITNPAGSYDNASGLFGAISSTSILRNIHIRSGNISGGGHNVGLLVGYARGEDDNIRPSIINSSAEGAVNASGSRVGGLVGDGRDARITSSYAAGGTVNGNNYVGGLVGDGRKANITSSYAAGGDVSGGGIVGGLVGDGDRAIITSSYAAGGAVSGDGRSVGGLVGYGDFSRITSSYAAGGAVSGVSNVGGLVGYGQFSIITSSYAAGGAVSGYNEVGGLVGDGRKATITSSYAAGGDVSGISDVGGLVGDGESVTITSSYAAGGAVSGDFNVGGLVGFGTDATITSSYAAGGAVSGDRSVGGLVGVGNGNTDITASYWDNSVTITPSTGNSRGEAKTTSELQSPVHATGIYATWTSLCPGTNKPAWYFGTSTQYPVLTCHPNSDSDRDGVPDIIDTDDDGDGIDDTADALPLNPTEDTDTDGDGVGDNADACDGLGAAIGWTSDATTDKDGDGCRDSDEDVDTNGNGLIEIATAQELNQTRYNLLGSSFKISATDAGDTNGCGGMEGVIACNGYELTQNISLADYSDWQPIGGCPTYASFECTDTAALFNTTFDGKDYIISNLTITNSNGDYDNASGLFGAISSTSILRNIHIRSGNISGGGRNVGLLVGYARGESDNIRPSIINSSAAGDVRASGSIVGGLVGDGQGATITSSYAAGGNVSGDDAVGGLVGLGLGVTITSSYAAGGDVSGTGDSIGGLVGDGRSATITSSYAAGGAVSGGFNVGGLIGDGQNAEITSSYAAGGAVSGTGIAVGGLVGNGQLSTITSSYAAGGSVSGTGYFVGGLVGSATNFFSVSTITVTASYWDSDKSGQESSDGGNAKTTEELKAGADGIYSTWASGTCADGTTRTWDFGTAADYPALNCTPNGLPAQEHLRQR